MITKKTITQITDLHFDKYCIAGVQDDLRKGIEMVIELTRNKDGYKYIHDTNIEKLRTFRLAYEKELAKNKVK